PVLYLYDLNAGFFVSTQASAGIGRLEQQAAGPLSDATASGKFFLGTSAPAAAGVNPIIGEGSLSGTGNFGFTEDGANISGSLLNDIVISGTYSAGANGRTPLGDGSVAWLVTPSKILSINAKPGKTNDTITTVDTGSKPSIDLSVTGPATASVAT